MTIAQTVKSIFLAQSNTISSKRVCGVLGWLISLGVLIYCTISKILAPVMIDTIVISSTALLGVDSITGIWKRKPDDDFNNRLL